MLPFGAILMSCPALKESSSSPLPVKSNSLLATKWSSSPDAQAFTVQRQSKEITRYSPVITACWFC